MNTDIGKTVVAKLLSEYTNKSCLLYLWVMFSRTPTIYKENILKILLRFTLAVSLLSAPATVLSSAVSSPVYVTEFVVKTKAVTSRYVTYNVIAATRTLSKWNCGLNKTELYARYCFNSLLKTKLVAVTVVFFNNVKPIFRQTLYFSIHLSRQNERIALI